jgi:tripartite-type tricarboxylate transporter receptor subunit TctC
VDARLVTHSCASADVRTSLADLGMEAKAGTAQDFAAALGEQAREWKTVIDMIGFKAE